MERKRVKGRFVAENKEAREDNENKGGVVAKQIAAPAASSHQASPQTSARRARSLVGLLLEKWKRSRTGGKDFTAAATR